MARTNDDRLMTISISTSVYPRRRSHFATLSLVKNWLVWRFIFLSLIGHDPRKGANFHEVSPTDRTESSAAGQVTLTRIRLCGNAVESNWLTSILNSPLGRAA